MSGAMMMKLPLRISRMSSREFPWRSMEFPPKRLRHSIIFFIEEGIFHSLEKSRGARPAPFVSKCAQNNTAFNANKMHID